MTGPLHSRPIKACITCALLISIFLISVTTSAGSWAIPNATTNSVGKIWSSFKAGKSIDEALEEVNAMVISKQNTPDWMLQEILDESWLYGAVANSDQTVLWVNKKGEIEMVKSEMGKVFESKGWEAIANEISDEIIETYVKTEGESRWLLVEYVQSGEDTIAVLRIERN